MKAVVCGSRDSRDRDGVFAALDRIHAETPITLLVEGGAEGVDHLAFLWAAAGNKCRSLAVSAEWGVHGKAAGPIRNRKMLDEKPDVIIAFMAGSGPGTANMVKQARAAGVRVVEIA